MTIVVFCRVGFKLVFLGNAIALNRSDIVRTGLDLYEVIGNKDEEEIETEGSEFFSRSPRIIEPLYEESIEIEAPPAPARPNNQPLLFVIGPSVTMPLPIIMSTLINSQINGSASTAFIGTIASVGISAIIGTCWALAHRFHNKKTTKAEEEFRVEAYNEYIAKNDALIRSKHNYNNGVLLSQYLSASDIVEKLRNDNGFLWNRNVNHKDFLTIRLGVGSVPFMGEIVVPKQRFSLHKDNMSELPHLLKEKYEYMENSTALLNLSSNKIIGMIGTDELMRKTAATMILQIAALHCYTDVKMAFFFTEQEEKHFGWTRWLPHTWSEDKKLRMVASDNISYQNVLYYIDGILRSRFEALQENGGKDVSLFPHYVIFCTSESIFDGDGIVKYISTAEKLGVTFVLLYKRMDLLPNETKMIVQSDESFCGMFSIEEKRSETDRVKFDIVTPDYSEEFARAISGLHVRQLENGEIPNSIDYLAMLGIGNYNQWNLLKKYKENRVFEGIRSFVGIGSGGKPLYLDIHEKRYGPHGLVAGTTGSGKSETLQTFIISLALNYHPDEVAFILIDYKGGGMANAFIGMPHIAGTITNLGDDNESGEIDANLTRRALVSIKSEIKRRQSIFNKYKVNHIDLYIRLYRDGKADEPLPHLIIISDEFAELKKEQPEFIKELVSTARVGRSLGIHLILATQKPAGVVDEEIWSNSRFKLCLRVQDKQDSMGMLRRPEAAFLTHTGRAYLQIGNDEVFEQFQSGYSGAAYTPSDEVSASSGNDVMMINIDGTPAVIKDSKKARDKNSKTQLEAAVEYISEVCSANGIKTTRALWMPVLPREIFLDNIVKEYEITRYGISAVVGVVDDPERQRQYPAVIDFTNGANYIIAGMSGHGKTTMMQTIMVSLMQNYTSEQIAFYILDFSSGMLMSFGKARHCGLAALPDNSEAVIRLIQFVNREMARRQKLFSEANVGSYNEYVKRHKLPLLMIFIDNFYSFAESYQGVQDDIVRITKDCAKYGIQFIVSVNSFEDIRYKLQQNFNNSIPLVLPDRGSYSSAFGHSADFMPENKKGRGLIATDGRILEYQAALPVTGSDESERNEKIAAFIDEVNERNKDMEHAPVVAVIPKDKIYSDFYAENNENGAVIPVGYNTTDTSIYGIRLHDTYCYGVSDLGYKGITLMLNNIAYGAGKCGEVHTIRLKTEFRLKTDLLGKVYSSPEDIEKLATYIHGELVKRAKVKRAFLEENPEGDYTAVVCSQFSNIFVIIDSISEFFNCLYSDAGSSYRSFIENAFAKSNGMGIYFIAGFDEAAHSGDTMYKAAAKNFVKYKTGIHLGGCLDKQKLIKSTLPISQVTKADDYFMGYTNVEGEEFKVFVPYKTGE